ncbi:hypothetical protein PHYC_03137 [Phycisphaerales bacterium]|nr:hypothetical protein PHYC_03137 [Phycisphaerales bacterium]
MPRNIRLSNPPSHTIRFSGRRGGIPKGCLIALAIVLALVVGVGIWVAVSWKGWAAGLGKSVAITMVDQSKLPQDQKTSITTRINQVADDWESGKITNDQLGNVIKEVVEGPIMSMAMVDGADEQYITTSKLTDDEKNAGRRSLQRFARGTVEKKIPQSELQSLVNMVTYKTPQGQTQLKQSLTDDELKSFLAQAKKAADDASIPDEEYKINYATELNKAIDKTLAAPAPPQ